MFTKRSAGNRISILCLIAASLLTSCVTKQAHNITGAPWAAGEWPLNPAPPHGPYNTLTLQITAGKVIGAVNTYTGPDLNGMARKMTSIKAGMSTDEVVGIFGKPTYVATSGEKTVWSYYFPTR